MINIDEEKSLNEIDQVLAEKSNFYISSSKEFDKCIKHIMRLIEDSVTLYLNNAYSSSLFLSIAVIEEVAKTHMGVFIKRSDEFVKHDKLRDHKTKEIIGMGNTVCMSNRLKNIIDDKKLNSLYDIVYSGELKRLREKSIYCECKNNCIITPEEIINKETSKNFLLLAIESFDDNLVGHTNYSMNVSKETDKYFDTIANS